MAEFTVTASEVSKKAEELKALNGQYRTVIEELEAEAKTLKGMWEGPAHDAFEAAFSKDCIQMTNFYNAIEQYCVTLSEIAANYGNTENKNVSIAGGAK